MWRDRITSSNHSALMHCLSEDRNVRDLGCTSNYVVFYEIGISYLHPKGLNLQDGYIDCPVSISCLRIIRSNAAGRKADMVCKKADGDR